MLKKTKKVKIIPKTTSPATEVVDTPVLKVEPCTLQFGSEDMNKLVEKLNEVIVTINKCQ